MSKDKSFLVGVVGRGQIGEVKIDQFSITRTSSGEEKDFYFGDVGSAFWRLGQGLRVQQKQTNDEQEFHFCKCSKTTMNDRILRTEPCLSRVALRRRNLGCNDPSYHSYCLYFVILINMIYVCSKACCVDYMQTYIHNVTCCHVLCIVYNRTWTH